jgi:FkbM family methyltransferase
VFVDVGACIGAYTIRACKNGLRTIAIEPDPDNYGILIENIKLNSCRDVDVYNIAVSDENSYGVIYAQSEGDYGTISLVGGRIPKGVVRIYRLDEILKELPHINLFVKIDVEGYEVKALKGMEKLFPIVKYVMVECIAERCRDVSALMYAHGFSSRYIICHKLQGLEHIHKGSFYCNALFTR